MRWFKKEYEKSDSAFQSDFITPVELNVKLDTSVCHQKIEKLLAYGLNSNIDVDALVDLLHEKHLCYSHLLDEQSIDSLQWSHIEILTNGNETLTSYLNTIPLSVLQTQLKMLLHGNETLAYRMNLFVECFGDIAKPKLETAIWNFMSELLHFYRPETYPLMSRWIWHESLQKGAMLEFMQVERRYNLSLGGQSVDFEAYRVWFAQQLGKKGIFQDVHYLIDLICAQAYTDYLLSISSKRSSEQAHLDEIDTSIDIMSKLLGINIQQPGPREIPMDVTLH